MLKITPMERAQIMLELLAKKSPAEYSTPLKSISAIGGGMFLLGTEKAEAILTDLPTDPQLLLRELRHHLQAMMVGCSTSEHTEIWGVFSKLPTEQNSA